MKGRGGGSQPVFGKLLSAWMSVSFATAIACGAQTPISSNYPHQWLSRELLWSQADTASSTFFSLSLQLHGRSRCCTLQLINVHTATVDSLISDSLGLADKFPSFPLENPNPNQYSKWPKPGWLVPKAFTMRFLLRKKCSLGVADLKEKKKIDLKLLAATLSHEGNLPEKGCSVVEIRVGRWRSQTFWWNYIGLSLHRAVPQSRPFPTLP